MRTVIVFLFLFIPVFCFSFEIDPYQNQKADNPCLKLVFLPINYSSKADLARDLGEIAARLKKILPFSEFTDKINFYQVGISLEEEKLLVKETQDFPPLVIHRDLLRNIEDSLKSLYKLVIIDAKGGVSCAELSEISKVSLIILGRSRYGSVDSFTKGLLHELGHSLGLRDEGLNSEAALCLPGPPNCAATKEEATNWWGDLVGRVSRVHYIHGCCGNKNYIRPTIASLMNDPDKAEDFGPVNERYLRQVLINIGR